MHPHKLAMTSAYLTGPFSHILLRARHHGDASRDSHRSAAREHCQCAAGRCRGSLGHAGVTPAARRLRPRRTQAPPRSRGKPRPRGCDARRTRAPPRSRVRDAWAATVGSVSCGGEGGMWADSRRCQVGADAYLSRGHGLGIYVLARGDCVRIMHVIIWLVFRRQRLYMADLRL